MADMDRILASHDRYRKAFLLLLLVFISALFISMIRPFLMTILMAAIGSALAQPLYSKFVGWVRGRRALASILTLIIILLVVVIPLLVVLGIVAAQAVKVSGAVGPWIQQQISNPDLLMQRLEGLPLMDRLRPFRAEILTKLGQLVGTVGNFMVGSLSAATRGTIAFIVHFMLMLYTMFYFIMDGGRILRKILYYMPLPNEDEERMVEKFVSVSRATLKGTLIIGIVQGTLAGTALAIVGVSGAVFWGTVMAILSVIPGVGTAIVWLPIAIYMLVTGSTGSGIFLIAFCGGIVGAVDNVLRPRLVGQDTKMHDLFIIFSTLGGILLFGVVGFIVGPILAALFITAWDIYGHVFRDVLPDGPSPASAADSDGE